MIYIKLVLLAIIWGGSFTAGRLLIEHLTPFSAAFMRFFLATLILGIWLWWGKTKFEWPKNRHWLYMFFLGLTGIFGYNALFFKGLETVSSGRAGLVIALNPVVTFLVQYILLRRLPAWLPTLGIFLSLLGALVVLTRGDFSALSSLELGIGELCLLGCVANWVAYAFLSKEATRHYNVMSMTFYAFFTGCIMLLPFALAEGLLEQLPGLNTAAWIEISYLGFIVSVFGFIWFAEGVKEVGPEKTAAFVNGVPIAAMILGYFFLGETLTWSLLFGAALIIPGVYIANLGRNHKKLF